MSRHTFIILSEFQWKISQKIEIIFETFPKYPDFAEIFSILIDKSRKPLYTLYSKRKLAGSIFVNIKKEDP